MSDGPVILALDQSASRTGWVRGRPEGPVELGSYANGRHGQNYGRALASYRAWLTQAVQGVDLVAFEQPVRPKILHMHTARLLYAIAGLIELVTIDAGIACVEADNGEHKKLIYGKGGKKPPDWLARQHAERWGLPAANIDEADAAGIFLFTVKHQYPDAFQRWVERRAAA